MNKVQASVPALLKVSDRRRKIVEEAEAMIAARGLRAFKVRDVAQAAGCALGTIYNEFQDVDALVLAVSLRTLERLGRALSAEQDPNPHARLHALAGTYLAFAVANPGLLQALFEHRLENGEAFPPDVIGLVDQAFALLETPLAALFETADREELSLFARSLFSAVHGIVWLGIERRIVAVPLDRLRAQLAIFVDAVLAGLSQTAFLRTDAE